MRLLIGITSGSSLGWNLVIRDVNFRPLASFTAKDFLDERGALTVRRWTGYLMTPKPILDLIADGNPDVKIEVFEGVALPPASKGARLYSKVNATAPWEELYEENKITAVKRAGDSVAMLVSAGIDENSVRTSWCCTGVLISPDVMMTNWHCGGSSDLHMTEDGYWSPPICENTVIDFGWSKNMPSRQYNCVGVLAADKKRDFALIRIKPAIGTGSAVGQPVPARISTQNLTDEMGLFIIHHSECAESLVSTCTVQSSSYPGWKGGNNLEFTHNCNTERGASGAPVFDQAGKLVGLHHVGVARASATCEPADGVNKAVKMSEIVEFLKEQNPAIAAELFDAGRQ